MGIVIGLVLGVVGAGWHLAVVRWRARQVTEGRSARAWLALPVGLAGPVLAFGAALVLAGDHAAWAFLAGAGATTGAVLLRESRGRR